MPTFLGAAMEVFTAILKLITETEAQTGKDVVSVTMHTRDWQHLCWLRNKALRPIMGEVDGCNPKIWGRSVILENALRLGTVLVSTK